MIMAREGNEESRSGAAIEVRDFREKAFFLMDDAYLNGYARLCGLAATGVYLSLCRHADKAQRSWPSIMRIAEELAISKSTVLRAIKKLEIHGIVAIERGRRKGGHQDVNVYVLIDKKLWITGLGVTETPREQGVKNDSKQGVTTVPEGYTPGRIHNSIPLTPRKRGVTENNRRSSASSAEIPSSLGLTGWNPRALGTNPRALAARALAEECKAREQAFFAEHGFYPPP